MGIKRVEPPAGWDELAPLERQGPLRHRVQDALRELIIARTLAPGDHLVETELADRLDVSRGPVREALQGLQTQGWVDLRPGRGAFVHQPTAREVDEVFVVRSALESTAAGLAAGHTSAQEAAELRRLCVTGRDALARRDEAEVVTLNSAFHRRVAALSGVDLLCGYVESLDLRVRWLYRPLVQARGLDSWVEHEEIVAALEAGDAEAATTLMRTHSERTRSAYRSVPPSGPDGTAHRTAHP